MKRLLFFLMATLFAMQGFSQATLNEGFEGTTFPPDDWRIETTSGGGTWVSSTSIAHGGTKSAKSGYYSGGCTRWLITPKLTVTATETNFSFWIACDNWYSNGDNIDVFVSTTDNSTSSFGTTALLALTEDSITTSWAQHTVDLSTFIGQDIYVAIRVTDNYGFNTFIDDVTGPELFVPACPKPTALTATNITATDADLGWTDDAGSMWTIQYMLASETDWANATEIAGVASNPYPIIGLLSPASNYKFRVQSLCGAEESEWSNVATFTTPCVPLSQFPWTEGFESILAANTLPPCWSATSLGTKTGTIITTGNDYNRNARTGTGAAWFQYGCNDSFKTPAFQFTENTFYDFTFWYVTDGFGGWTSLKAELYNAETNTLIGNIGTEVTLPPNTTYEIYTSTFTVPDETASYYIAIKCVATTVPLYLTIDDISIQLTPDCPDVYGLSAEVASTTSVSVNWDNSGDLGDGFNIAYSSNLSVPFDPTTATNISIPTGTTLPYIIPGFNPGDSVWVAVQRGCLGNWTEAQKVILPTSSNLLPFSFDFEDSTIYDTWTINNGTQTNKWFIGPLGANGTGNGLYISSDNGITAGYSNTSSVVMVSTLIEFDNSPEFALSFDWKAGGESSWDYIYAYIIPIGVTLEPGTLPNATYKVTPSYLNLESTWQTENISLGSEYSNSIQQVVFAWKNDGSGTQPGGMIDNINIVGLTCPSTTDLVASNITTTSADISWNSNLSSVADWWIYWKQNSATEWADSLHITTNPYTLTGLLANTPYEVVIINNCGQELSLPMNILEFRTACGVVSALPYSENFDTYGGTGTAFFPSCWTKVTTNSSYPYLSTTNNSAPASLYFYATTGTYNYAATSPFDVSIPINSLMATFQMRKGNATSLLTVGVMTDPTDITTFDSITTVSPSATVVWEEFEVNFSSYTGTGTYIAFKSQYNTATNYFYLDDLVIDVIPTCAKPISATATNITGTTADLSWTPGNASDFAWKIYYRPSGTSDWDSVMVTNNPYNLTGLLPSTNYEVGISTDCGTGEFSNMRLMNFRTQCGAITSLPWTDNFDSYGTGTNIFPGCWTRNTTYADRPHVHATSYSSPGSLYFYSATAGTYNIAATPMFDQTINISSVRASFMFRNMNATDTLKVGVMTDPSQESTWVEVGRVSHSSAQVWVADTISFANYTGTGQYIAFRIDRYSTTSQWSWMDDLVIEYDVNSNPCPQPTNVVVIPSNSSANVTWSIGAESAWEVRLGTTGTPIAVSTPSYTIPALSPGTTYTVYVRSNCGTGYSAWVSAQFTTNTDPTPPTVTTAVPTTMISQTTAVFNGTYVQTTDAILTKGFEYKAASAATWTNEVVTDGTTPFTFSPTGLVANTAYEVKAYVTTATFNTTYGNTVAFTTLETIAPTVTTDSVKVLSETSAIFYGKITENTEAIEARGFEYKLSSQAWADAINISATGVTEISATPTTLTLGSYNVRAYARTLSGTEYGQVLTFQTQGLDGIDGQDISIMMYPNPATSQTNLIVNGINGETKIILSDVQGRILNTINAKPVSGTIEQTIDLNNLAKGVYYIRIQNSDINRTQKLIVK